MPTIQSSNITTAQVNLQNVLSQDAYIVWNAIIDLARRHIGKPGTFKRNGNWAIHFSYKQLKTLSKLPTMAQVRRAVRELIALGIIEKVPYYEAAANGGDIPDFHGVETKMRAPFYELRGFMGIGADPLVKAAALRPILGKLKEADAEWLAEALNDTAKYGRRARSLKP